MKISIKIVFFINTTMYFIVLKKIWDLIFDIILPPIGRITYVIHLTGLLIFILPASLILTHCVFKLAKKNY